MNEFLRNFVMTTILKMIDSDRPEWEVRQLALGWYTKGVLTETDLQTIDDKYKEKEEEQEQEQEQEDTIQIPLNEEESINQENIESEEE